MSLLSKTLAFRHWAKSISHETREWNSVSHLQQSFFPEGFGLTRQDICLSTQPSLTPMSEPPLERVALRLGLKTFKRHRPLTQVVSEKSHSRGCKPATSSPTLRPVFCSTCSHIEGMPPDVSSREIRSTRHIGKNRSPNPTKGSSCITARNHSSNEFKSRPRRNTPA